jgi:hypothetical protein
MSAVMRPSNLVEGRPWHFMHLAEHLRPDEQANWLAITGMDTYQPDVAVKAMLATPGMAFAIVDAQGIPVVGGGFTNLRGNAWSCWMVGTPEGWESHWRSITRGVRWVMAEMFAAGATRLEVMTLATREAAMTWYERALGMECEGILRAAGAHGEDLAMYARTTGENR